MLTAADLASMRSTVDDSLPDSAGIITRTLTPDTYGGQTDTWSTSATVACRLAPIALSTGEREQAGAELDIQRWLITLPANTVIAPTDRIEIGARTFEVITISARRTWELHTAVICEEVL